MKNYGFIRVAAGSPKLEVANPRFNASQIVATIESAAKQNCSIVVFPELCISGYTCGDLFFQSVLLDQSLAALEEIMEATKADDVMVIVGLPVQVGNQLFNCAAVLLNGRILGIVPKTHIPNHKEFYERRWFESGTEAHTDTREISIAGQEVPFGHLLFDCTNDEFPFSLGVEICEDLWVPIPPSSHQALNGALVIANLSASNELVAKADYRMQLVSQQSARCIAGYIYSSAGVYESTTDVVMSGDCMIAENGTILARARRFQRNSVLIVGEIDIDRLRSERRQSKSFLGSANMGRQNVDFRRVRFRYLSIPTLEKLSREVDPHPFVPAGSPALSERCDEILHIQTAGLAKRLEHTKAESAVIAVSGGLDSTLALLVTAKTFDLLNLDRKRILAVTMPGFGTTDRTYSNALELTRALGVTLKEIDIKPSCLQHFKDIGHDQNIHDVTYENAQARERTQILMDLANKVNGLVVGTGDLSELALGWATYNGDHMSMYGVNAGVPKTLVRFLVKWIADSEETRLGEVLYRIIDTPISPELVPSNKAGDIEQKTEDIVGPYELHDFFLYYMVRHAMPPKKIAFLAQHAFDGKYGSKDIEHWLRIFCKRFFSQQFKRSCLPDGPKVGSVSLSPRGDWRMPSDASSAAWIGNMD